MKLTNTFLGGIDRDLSIIVHQNNTLYDCQNLRLLTDEGLSTSSLENVKGTTLLKNFNDSNYENFVAAGSHVFPTVRYVGSCVIRDVNVIFTTSRESGGEDQIWEMLYDRQSETYKYWLRYTGDLGLSTDYPIYRAIGRYESTEAIKIYWTDNHNVLRFCNISDVDATTGLLNISDTSFFEMKSRADLQQPTLRQISGGGRFKAGMIQYVYQYFNKYSSTSFYSPSSEMIHLTKESDYKSNTWTYIGAALGDDVYKSIYISIPTVDTRYNYVRVYSFFYAQYNDTPIITLIAEKEVVGGTPLTVVDNGTKALDTLAYTTYVAQRNQEDFICKGLTEQKNMLFPANIDEVEWDVDYDARVLRFCIDPSTLWYMNLYTNYTTNQVPIITGYFAKYLSLSIGGVLNPNTQFATYADVVSYLTAHNEKDDDYNINIFNRGISPVDWNCKNDRKYNTAIIGGTGINISYKIKVRQILVDRHPNATRTHTNIDNASYVVNGRTINNISYKNMASPYLSGLFKGYQRGEIYAFGIVFYDKKGRSSFVKWIGDIRMPNQDDLNGEPTFSMWGIDYYDYRLSVHDTNSEEIYGNIIYPEFTVNIPAALSQEISGFDIVRCKRNDVDRTVFGYGPLVNSWPDPAGTSIYYKTRLYVGWYMPHSAAAIQAHPNIPKSYHTPEIAYNKNFTYTISDYLIIDAVSTYRYSYTTPAPNEINVRIDKEKTYTPVTVKHPYSQHVDDFENIHRFIKIEDAINVDTNEQTSVNNLQFNNRGYATTLLKSNGTAGVVMKTSGNIISAFLNDVFVGIHCWYKRKVGADTNNPLEEWKNPLQMYNGEGYYERARRTYISCGVNSPVSTSGIDQTIKVDCYGGDVFVCMHEQFITTKDIPNYDDAERPFLRVISYITESTINCDLIHGSTLTKGETVGSGRDPGYYQEKAGIYTSLDGYIHTQLVDMYKYNTVYSHENDANEFIPEPIHYIKERLDCEIRFSNQKFDRELIDSWTIFDTNSFNNVSSKYGAITDVLSWKEQFVFIQPTAIGLYAVNERALISDQSGQPVILGSSGVLDRYDYKSYRGSRLQGSTIATDKTIYFFDDSDRKICTFGIIENDIGTSEILGLSSFLHYNYEKKIENEDNCISNSTYHNHGIVAGWNKRFKEVYFTFKNYPLAPSSYKNYTLSVNELTGKYMSFFGFQAGGYINSNNGFFSLPNAGINRGNYLYKHDVGDYGNFYGSVYNSIIDVISTYKGMIGIFDSLEYLTEVYKKGTWTHMYDVDVYNITYDHLRVRNDYQDSMSLNLIVDDTVQRRMRKWRIAEIIRDNSTDSPRMRDSYMKSMFTFHNTNNYRLVAHPIETEVRIHGM